MYAKELRLAVVTLEEADKDQAQDDEDARRRLQGHMEVLMCTAYSGMPSAGGATPIA